MMESDPDWAPSLHLGHTQAKEADPSCQDHRHQARANGITAVHRQMSETETRARSPGTGPQTVWDSMEGPSVTGANNNESADSEGIETDVTSPHTVDRVKEVSDSQSIQTGVTSHRIDRIKETGNGQSIQTDNPACHIDSIKETTGCQSVQTDMTSRHIDRLKEEIDKLRQENINLREKLKKKDMSSPDFFEGDDRKVRYYTGLPSFASLTFLLNCLDPCLPRGARRQVSAFQMVMVTFLRLRLNLPEQHLAYRLGLHRAAVATAFLDTVAVMYAQLPSAVITWPDRRTLVSALPCQYREAFGSKVVMIVHCLRISIQSPASAQTGGAPDQQHSSGRKYLIAVTPSGAVSFVSKGWCGSTSDRLIAEKCNFLDCLLPGDVVLAAGGFDLEDGAAGLVCAEVKASTTSPAAEQRQLCARGLEDPLKAALLKGLVDPVIGNVMGKYRLLTESVPFNMTSPCEGEDLTCLDKVVKVCCALTNMCHGVV
ncbi:hypothetical protein ACOMHN_024153 [Nucella lapillus]